MADDKIVIEIDLDAGTTKAAFTKIENQSGKASKKISRNLSSAFSGKFIKSIGKATLAVGALGTALATAIGGRRAIQAAIRQENAVTELNTALKLAGSFSKEASQSFQEFASSIQRTTRFGDELVLSMVPLARSFVNTNEEAQDLIKASIDLSEGLGGKISVESAVRNLGKSLSGLAGELGESVKEIRTFTQSELEAGKAIEFATQRFGGAAQANVKTFGRSMEQLSNNFGDFLERLGETITKSPVAIKIIKTMADGFASLADSVKLFNEDGNVFRDALKELITFGFLINKFVIAPVELGVNLIRAFFNLASSMLLTLPVLASSAIGIFAEAANTFGIISDEARDKFKGFSNAANQNLKDFVSDTNTLFGRVFNFDSAAKTEEFLAEIQMFVENVIPGTQEAGNKIGDKFTAGVSETITFEAIFKEFDKLNKKTKSSAEGIAKALRTTLASGVTNAFAAFGAALVTGENAFAAFGKAVLGVFGDILISIGTNTLLAGLGMSAVPVLFGPQGPAAIVAGGAMIVAGGALKALAGGGGGGSTASAPSSGGGVTSTGGTLDTENTVTALEDTEDQGPQTNVTVQIQGNVLDRKETGLELVEVLNEAFAAQGTTVVVS